MLAYSHATLFVFTCHVADSSYTLHPETSQRAISIMGIACNWLPVRLPHGVSSETYLVPSLIVRSTIFGSQWFRGRVTRQAITSPVVCAEYGQVRIWQTAGYPLDMADADVWRYLLDLALKQPVEDATSILLELDESTFLRQLGRATGTSNRNWLFECLSRLTSNTYHFEARDLNIADFKLVESDVVLPAERQQAQSYKLKVDPRLVRLFQSGWSPLRKDVLEALGSDTLAIWLYGVLVRWSGDYAPSVAYLQALSGRAGMRSDHFLKALENSLANLTLAAQWQNVGLRDGKIMLPERRKPQTTAGDRNRELHLDDDI